ncbi:MAG: tyrosine-type recombinase/integrase [Planctomycetes bacterium]|nr:tyrosine-type recombinase/integrase [Planctomycetota bacterium]
MQTDVDAYLQQIAAEGLSVATIRAYRQRLRALTAFLQQRGIVRPADVVPADLDAYVLNLVERGLKRSSRQCHGETIVEFFRRLQAKGRVLMNPARDLPIPEDDIEVLPPRPLTQDEVADLFQRWPKQSPIDLRNRLHLELLYSCALRLEESVSLDLDHIDLRRRRLRVVNGKGGKDRDMPLYRGVLGALKDYLAVRRSLLRGPDRGALLLDIHGRRLGRQNIQQTLRKVTVRGGWNRLLHPHLFRHSLAVHMLQRGADVRAIQDFLGHASLETTKVYLRMVPGRLKDDYDAAMPEIDVGLGA